MVRKFLIALFSIIFIVSLIFTGITIYDYLIGAPYQIGVVQAAKPGSVNLSTAEQPELSPLAAANKIKPLSSNAVGWLRIPNADIDNAVLQTNDNQYYLEHDEYDNYSIWGCYFFSCDNIVDTTNLDRVTLIFGHSNGNAQHLKFSTLKKYKDVNFAQENQFIELWFGDTKTIWQIFSACDYPVSEHTVMNPNPNDTAFMDQVNRLKDLSYNEYKETVSKDDKLLFLVTCSGNDTYDYRFVVAAKLVEIK